MINNECLPGIYVCCSRGKFHETARVSEDRVRYVGQLGRLVCIFSLPIPLCGITACGNLELHLLYKVLYQEKSIRINEF